MTSTINKLIQKYKSEASKESNWMSTSLEHRNMANRYDKVVNMFMSMIVLINCG